jgi:hypothetical protein
MKTLLLMFIGMMSGFLAESCQGDRMTQNAWWWGSQKEDSEERGNH